MKNRQRSLSQGCKLENVMIGPKATKIKLEEDANESSKKKLNTEKVSSNGGNRHLAQVHTQVMVSVHPLTVWSPWLRWHVDQYLVDVPTVVSDTIMDKLATMVKKIVKETLEKKLREVKKNTDKRLTNIKK